MRITPYRFRKGLQRATLPDAQPAEREALEAERRAQSEDSVGEGRDRSSAVAMPTGSQADGPAPPKQS